MIETLEKYSPEDFISVLPPTTKEYALTMLQANVDLTKVALQLSNEPGAGLATKSGDVWPKDIGPRIIQEVHTLLCTDDKKYTKIREQLKGEGITSANVLVYVISNVVAIHAGMAAAICVPLVALLLAAVVKVGLAAWCQSISSNVALTGELGKEAS